MKYIFFIFALFYASFSYSGVFPTHGVIQDASQYNNHLRCYDSFEQFGKPVNISQLASCASGNRFMGEDMNGTPLYSTTCHVVKYYGTLAINCGTNLGTTVRVYSFRENTLVCPSGTEFDGSTGYCESSCDYGVNDDGSCMDACQFKESIGDDLKLYWHPAVYGELVTGACYGDFGATRCEMRKSSPTVLCTGVPDGQYLPESQCSTDFVFTGNQCDGGTLFWGDKGPDEPIIPPEEPEDPTHDPDDPTGDIEDPSVLPDDSTNKPLPPDVDDKPDVENPDTDETTDTAVLEAIKGLNSDLNDSIHSLHVDLNKSQTDISGHLIDVNASVIDGIQATQEQQINDNKIYENTKALIQQANADITTSVNNNTNATIGVREDLKALDNTVDGLGDSLTSISDGVSGLDETLTSISDKLDGGEFGTPTGDTLPTEIFSLSDVEEIISTVEEQKQYLTELSKSAAELIGIETNFKKGKLNNKKFEVGDTTVESGLQRFDEVSNQVRPVILFICALTALWILFGTGARR